MSVFSKVQDNGWIAIWSKLKSVQSDGVGEFKTLVCFLKNEGLIYQ